MEKKIQETLQKWLDVDFYYIASKSDLFLKKLR